MKSTQVSWNVTQASNINKCVRCNVSSKYKLQMTLNCSMSVTFKYVTNDLKDGVFKKVKAKCIYCRNVSRQ